MKYSVLALLPLIGATTAVEQDCTATAFEDNGNWYCGAVDQIIYQSVDNPGTFQAVTNMGSDGTCSMTPQNFGGSLAPFDEELSVHIRGPFQLKEFAVYTPSSFTKRSFPTARANRHGHGHRHGQGVAYKSVHPNKHAHLREKHDARAHPTASGSNFATQHEGKAPTPAHAAAHLASMSRSVSVKNSTHAQVTPKIAIANNVSSWSRFSYYNSEQQVADNVMFMANYGGQGSGIWDSTWGNSLAYLNTDGVSASSSPQILQDTSIPSNKEFSIFSAEQCDDSCGYMRDPDVSYKGFGGADKVFLYRFQMPLDGTHGFNADMPALWMLNANIPRTAQYSSCNCWGTGCGEIDLFEVLDSGDTKCKSTIHLNRGGGSSDYFNRPTNGFIRVAVVFDSASSSIAIKTLPDDTDFADGLDPNVVQSWLQRATDGSVSSIFQIA